VGWNFGRECEYRVVANFPSRSFFGLETMHLSAILADAQLKLIHSTMSVALI
jgi:hypothetical protein